MDIEMPRDPVTGRRRRTTRQIEGSRREAEVALARLKVAHEERRLPSRGTTARTVRAVFDAYLEAADSDQVELAPRTIVTTRSAANTMSSVRLLDVQAKSSIARQRERHVDRWGTEISSRWYVFSNPTDPAVPYRPDSFTDRWSTLRGTSPVTLQQLRHFAATVVLDAGESYRTVADLLGNSENTLRLHYDGRNDVGKRRAITALNF